MVGGDVREAVSGMNGPFQMGMEAEDSGES